MSNDRLLLPTERDAIFDALNAEVDYPLDVLDVFAHIRSGTRITEFAHNSIIKKTDYWYDELKFEGAVFKIKHTLLLNRALTGPYLLTRRSGGKSPYVKIVFYSPEDYVTCKLAGDVIRWLESSN